MSAWVPMNCPIDGCPYVATFRLDDGEETSNAAYAEQVAVLRKEHPNHAAPVAEEVTESESQPTFQTEPQPAG